jgi:hypothetical protein
MYNLIILICGLIGIPVLIAQYLDSAWLLPEQKQQLRSRFESWWLAVVDYDRMKFVLVCTQAFNSFADLFFGEKLISKKAFFRCSIIATGLLITSLACTGILNNKMLGIEPWATYQESCEAVSDYADFIDSSGLTKTGLLERPNVTFSAAMINNTNGANSASDTDPTPAFLSVMILHDMLTNEDAVHGDFVVAYYFSGHIPGDVNKPEMSQAQTWSNNVAVMRQGVERYDSHWRWLWFSYCDCCRGCTNHSRQLFII